MLFSFVYKPVISKRGKARYKRGRGAQYSGFKLVTSTFVLSVIVKALRFCRDFFRIAE